MAKTRSSKEFEMVVDKQKGVASFSMRVANNKIFQRKKEPKKKKKNRRSVSYCQAKNKLTRNTKPSCSSVPTIKRVKQRQMYGRICVGTLGNRGVG